MAFGNYHFKINYKEEKFMKKTGEFKGFCKGVIVTGLVLGMGGSVFGASGVLEQIYVDKKPIQIVIDGQTKNPPANMQPMIYNGTTYVPLRYIGEVMGKQVTWNDATRTVNIGAPQLAQGSFRDAMTNGAISENWNNQGKIQGDGPNGIIMQDGKLILENVLPDAKCDYLVEFEASGFGVIFDLFNVYLGKSGDKFTDIFSGGYYGIRYNNSTIAKIDLESDIYYQVKLEVKKNQCNVYIDNEFITSHKLEGDKSAFAFTGNGYYIRNVKVTVE